MLLDYTYLLTDFDASFFNSNFQTAEFICPINEQITSNSAEVFQTLLKSESHFCFYIPFQLTRRSDKFFKEETFRNIIRLLFLPNYLRVDQKIVFFSEKVNVEEKVFEDLKNEFYVQLKKQGINDFIVEALEPGQSSQNEPAENSISLYDDEFNSYLNGTKEECFQTFVNSHAFKQNFYKKWIVTVANQDNFQRKIKLIEKFEKWMWETHPFSDKIDCTR